MVKSWSWKKIAEKSLRNKTKFYECHKNMKQSSYNKITK